MRALFTKIAAPPATLLPNTVEVAGVPANAVRKRFNFRDPDFCQYNNAWSNVVIYQLRQKIIKVASHTPDVCRV